MSALRVAVNGAAGRMGRRLVSLLSADPEIELVSAIERPGHPDLGRDVGELAGLGPVGVYLTEGFQNEPQAVIDFSMPEGAAAIAQATADLGVPFVSGTTGLDAHQKAAFQEAAGRVPLVHEPNFSIGVNVLFEISHRVAQILGQGYDVEIVEAHHNQKQDSPSGTALKLAESVARALHRDPAKDLVHGRHGQVGAREAREIGMHAVRAGDIVGEHTVIFGGRGERIELTHKAHTRDNFVAGSIRAAKWLQGKAPGRYSMKQVLGLA